MLHTYMYIVIGFLYPITLKENFPGGPCLNHTNHHFDCRVASVVDLMVWWLSHLSSMWGIWVQIPLRASSKYCACSDVCLSFQGWLFGNVEAENCMLPGSVTILGCLQREQPNKKERQHTLRVLRCLMIVMKILPQKILEVLTKEIFNLLIQK